MTDTPWHSPDDAPPLDETTIEQAMGSAFVSTVYSVEEWYARARALYAAAKAVWERGDQLHDQSLRDRMALEAVAFMLAGMSLECLLKAVIVGEVPESNQKIELPRTLKTHNLLSLAKDAGIAVSDDEEHCLRILTDHVVWAGRYPAPTSVEKLGHCIIPDFRDAFFALYGRIARRFDITI